VTEQLAVGIGAYVAGGSKAIYENVDFSGLSAALTNFKPTIKADLNLIEYSLGVAYEVLEGLRVGASWRVVSLSGSIGSFNQAGSVFNNVLFNNISDTNLTGARVGVQYYPRESAWGAGAFFRSEMNFAASSTTSGTAFTPPSTSAAIPATAATLSATLPWQVGLGLHYDFVPKLVRAMLQYEFTEYATDRFLGISTALPGVTNLTLNWRNMNVIRVGGEYHISDPTTLRIGYAITSQVVPATNASPIYSSPGLGHTVVIGAGTYFSRSISFNGALEYSFASGTSESPVTAGTYSSNDFTAHFGLNYSL
jgi:long-subunit fatty acid transport protein